MRDVGGIYDRLGAGYDRLSAVLDRTAVNRMRTDLLARARGEVLEIAVGTGVNLRRYPPGVRVTGLDLSATALATAAGRTPALRPLRADAAAIPLRDGCVDTVVCTLAGCTFTDPAAVFAEMRRVLRPDGRVLFLEHVRAAHPLGAAALRAVKPLTVAALGCHPDRDTVATIAAAGFRATVLDRAIGGLFVAVEASV